MGIIYEYKISEIKKLTNDVKVIQLFPKNTSIPKFIAGQFVFLHLLIDGKSVEKRPYSIASAPETKNLEFCIKMINGKMTTELDKLKIGDIIGVDGPYGGFGFTFPKKAAFVAGGTGIAPIMSMLRSVKSDLDGVLFYTAKTKDTILYKKELEEFSKKFPKFKIVITLTQEKWEGEMGRINQDLIKKYLPDCSDYDWWMCGPLELLKNTKDAIISLGANIKRLKMEGWG